MPKIAYVALAVALAAGAARAQPAATSLTPNLAPAMRPQETAATPQPARALTLEDAETWLDGMMPYALARGDVAGAVVVVVKDGQVLLQKGYGKADIATNVPVDAATTLFRPGSVSKLFTWTAVMQLVEQKRIDLDTDINQYLDFTIPAFRGKPITMRNLLTHTPGFEEVVKNLIFAAPRTEPPLAEFVKAGLPTRIYPPGEIPAYSNYGAALAGYIVQRVSGEAFDAYIENHIFMPLGMRHASFRQPLPDVLEPSMSQGYDRASAPPKPFEIVGPAPAGSSSISGGDMAHFMIAHLQNGEYQGQRILQEATAREMHDTRLTTIPPLHSMLLGFYEMDRNGHRIIGHDGDTQWFHSELSLFPDDHVGLFVSLNSSGNSDTAHAVRKALFESFTDRYFPGPGPQGHMDKAAQHADGAELAGTYINSRRSETNFLSLVNYLSPTKLSVDEDGLVTMSDVLSLGGAPQKFEEIAPFVWRAVGGKARLAARRQAGHVSMVSEDTYSAVFVFQPVPGLKNASWLLPAIGLSFAALLLTGLSWPVVAVIRRRYHAPFARTGTVAHAYRGVRLVALLDALLLAAWVGTIGYMLTSFSFGPAMDPGIDALHWLSIAIFPGALLVALWNAWIVWRNRRGWRSWFARGWSVVTVLSCAVIAWTGAAFHLIGLGVRY